MTHGSADSMRLRSSSARGIMRQPMAPVQSRTLAGICSSTVGPGRSGLAGRVESANEEYPKREQPCENGEEHQRRERRCHKSGENVHTSIVLRQPASSRSTCQGEHTDAVRADVNGYRGLTSTYVPRSPGRSACPGKSLQTRSVKPRDGAGGITRRRGKIRANGRGRAFAGRQTS